jgi:apolipoprotein D and lipocalin family protein
MKSFRLYQKSLLSFLFLLFFIGCTQYKPLATVKSIDIEKYQGVWYEIARYEQFFEKGCSDINATYSLLDNAKIEVLNQCIKNGELSHAKGIAYAIDSSNTKLKVSFFWPFYGNYWILDIGENYEYALIGEPSRKYLWILSRTKALDDKRMKKILKLLPSLGYDEKKLIWSQPTFKQF